MQSKYGRKEILLKKHERTDKHFTEYNQKDHLMYTHQHTRGRDCVYCGNGDHKKRTKTQGNKMRTQIVS